MADQSSWLTSKGRTAQTMQAMCVELEKAEVADLSSQTFGCRATCDQHRGRERKRERDQQGASQGESRETRIPMVDTTFYRHCHSFECTLGCHQTWFDRKSPSNSSMYIPLISPFYSHRHLEFTPASPRLGALAVFDTRKITTCITLLATEVRESWLRQRSCVIGSFML